MNPRAEFVKAVMSVLRLEANIYTTGAIETIIERLEVSDYQLFIAYLGERKSDFEKPIENIAKGVDEFYLLKLKPFERKAEEINNKIIFVFSEVKNLIETQSIKNVDMEAVEQEVQHGYSKQSDQIQENNRHQFKQQAIFKLKQEGWERFLLKGRDDSFFKMFIFQDTKEPLFNKDLLDIIFEIGGLKITDSNRRMEELYKYFLRGKIKPSVSEQIESKSEPDKELILCNKVKNMIGGAKW